MEASHAGPDDSGLGAVSQKCRNRLTFVFVQPWGRHPEDGARDRTETDKSERDRELILSSSSSGLAPTTKRFARPPLQFALGKYARNGIVTGVFERYSRIYMGMW
jgi:hypothetical protein